jgi:non-specific serine/threonine protein kinase
VLDDCDRHVETVADVVTELLAACPHLRVLASSREPLRVPGEMTYDVRPLRPADTTRLFEELTGHGQQALGDLRDGLPLAIELAVAPAETRPGPGHHASMQAAIDWSYDLLSPAEQALFGRLSHFVGPFSLDAVEEECVGGCVERDDVIALLLALVAKSLVVAEEDHGDTRYRLLDALRRYGEGRRPAEGDACPDARGWDSHTRSEEER